MRWHSLPTTRMILECQDMCKHILQYFCVFLIILFQLTVMNFKQLERLLFVIEHTLLLREFSSVVPRPEYFKPCIDDSPLLQPRNSQQIRDFFPCLISFVFEFPLLFLFFFLLQNSLLLFLINLIFP